MKKNFINWFKASGIIAIKAMAQTAVAMIGAGAVMDKVNWMMIGSSSLCAGILSVLGSVKNLPEYAVNEEEKPQV